MDSKNKKKTKLFRIDFKWVISITFFSFLISMLLSYASSEAIQHVNNLIAFIILLAVVILGIVFDIIGVAATSGDEKQFHSMAAKKVSGAKEAVWLVQNAEKVASFCNDVVGDIAGIISGATGAIIVARIIVAGTPQGTVIQLVITGLISALTIGGKAMGKGFGISYSGKILFAVGKILHVFPWFPGNKK